MQEPTNAIPPERYDYTLSRSNHPPTSQSQHRRLSNLEPSQFDKQHPSPNNRVTYDDLYAWLCEIDWIRPSSSKKKTTNEKSRDGTYYRRQQDTKRGGRPRQEDWDVELTSTTSGFYQGANPHRSKRRRQHF